MTILGTSERADSIGSRCGIAIDVSRFGPEASQRFVCAGLGQQPETRGEHVMDRQESPEDPSGTQPDIADVSALVSTAHGLMSMARLATVQEVLLTAVVDALASQERTAKSLLDELQHLWPESGIRREHLVEVLQTASELGVVRRMPQLLADSESESIWQLTPTGMAEVRSTQDWLTEVLARFSDQMQARAESGIGQIAGAQAELWCRLVLSALNAAIQSDERALAGDVRRSADGGLRAVNFSLEPSLAFLAARVTDPGVLDFLRGCVLAAVDEADSFGNEIAGAVATAAVLRGVVSRIADREELDRLGPLTGVRVVVDTPCLLDILNPDDDTLETLVSARACGLDVVVFEHYLDELHDLIARVERDYPEVLAHHATEPQVAAAAAMLADDQVIEIFLRGLSKGRYDNWPQFVRGADELASRLTASGITVRVAGNADPAQVDRCREALQNVLTDKGSTRGHVATDRDSETMAAVWRWRRRDRSGRLWPAGWVLSRDGKIGPAFARATGDSRALVLTPSQLSTMLATLGPAADASRMIAVAASELRHEAMIGIALRYPPHVAYELAKGLDRAGATGTDQRIAQLGLNELLGDGASHPAWSSDRIASAVMAMRGQRMNAAVTETQRRSRSQELAATERADRAEAQLRARQSDLQNTLSALEARPTSQQLTSAVEHEREIGRRRVIRAIVVTVAVGAGFILLLWPRWLIAAIGFWAAAVWFFEMAESWVVDPAQGKGRLFFALFAVVIGVLVQLVAARL